MQFLPFLLEVKTKQRSIFNLTTYRMLKNGFKINGFLEKHQPCETDFLTLFSKQEKSDFMSSVNAQYAAAAAAPSDEFDSERRAPTVVLLPGDREMVVRDIPKNSQGGWIVKAGGHFNSHPAINGYIFSRSQIQTVRDNVPGLTGDLAIYDASSYVPVVFTAFAPKAGNKEKEKFQRADMAKLGFTWNSGKGQYEGPVSLYSPAKLEAIAKVTK